VTLPGPVTVQARVCVSSVPGSLNVPIRVIGVPSSAPTGGVKFTFCGATLLTVTLVWLHPRRIVVIMGADLDTCVPLSGQVIASVGPVARD